jgi:hypothetical protein
MKAPGEKHVESKNTRGLTEREVLLEYDDAEGRNGVIGHDQYVNGQYD